MKTMVDNIYRGTKNRYIPPEEDNSMNKPTEFYMYLVDLYDMKITVRVNIVENILDNIYM